MFSIVLMAALTSSQAAPDFLFHRHHCCGCYQGCCSTACYGGYCCYSSPGYWGGCACSSYGVGCYSGCCYSACGCYSACCGGCMAYGGMAHGDAVNANGGWGLPYSSYAPMGGDPHGAPWMQPGVVPESVYPGGVANPPTEGPTMTDPMKKADDKTKDKDGKDKDGKDKDGRDKDGKDKDMKKTDTMNKPSPNRARLIVSVPTDAKLYIDDQPMKAGSERRSFSTPNLVEGETYFYEIRVEIMRDGKPINEVRKVNVRAGEVARVDFHELDSTSTVKAK